MQFVLGQKKIWLQGEKILKFEPLSVSSLQKMVAIDSITSLYHL